ncbi:MAG: ATP-binding protein [Nitrospira sp.]|nr:ATP-binding protein [Nitrospira sp.]MDE0487524.1 ATP-binding protein [Nitrospira sp.]
MMNPSFGQRILFPLTIGQRLLIMVGIFILALGAILSFTYTAAKALELDVVVLDVAGRQRMMIQWHLNEMLLAYNGIPADPRRTQRLLLHSLDALQNGGDVIVNLYTNERRSIPVAPTARIRDLLEQQRILLERFFTETRTLLLEDPDRVSSSESFSLLNQLQQELLLNADTVFKLFSAHSKQNLVNLLKSQPVIGLLVIILSIVLARQVVSTSHRLEREIEQRKKAEDARKTYEAELVLRDRSINSATNGIIIVDARQPDMPTVYCNAAFEKITGYAKEEVIGRNCRFLQGADHQQPGLDAIRRAIRQGAQAKAELRNYRKDGSPFWNELYVAPVKDQKGQLTHFIGIQTDITHRKRQEIELANKTRELTQSNAELQQFAYVASHDLQEPLRMVASYTQLLRKRYRGKLDKDADEFIEYAVDGATRMQRLIHDLLEYSRIGSENKPFQETDCEVVLQQVLANLSASVREHRAEVTHGPLPTIHVNPTHMMQVFQNLIGNALKFQGDAPPKIHVVAKALPDGWEFSIRDNGLGIPDDQLVRIFSIFQRLHGQGDYPGTGIGLAICKRIVEKYGGNIRVESERGKGSTFYFTLMSPREVMELMPSTTDPSESATISGKGPENHVT